MSSNTASLEGREDFGEGVLEASEGAGVVLWCFGKGVLIGDAREANLFLAAF